MTNFELTSTMIDKILKDTIGTTSAGKSVIELITRLALVVRDQQTQINQLRDEVINR